MESLPFASREAHLFSITFFVCFSFRVPPNVSFLPREAAHMSGVCKTARVPRWTSQASSVSVVVDVLASRRLLRSLHKHRGLLLLETRQWISVNPVLCCTVANDTSSAHEIVPHAL